jgi:peptidoglycan hydrolase-like protein with peptidoglycan-binding domain
MAKKTAEKAGSAVTFEGPDHAPRTEIDDTGDLIDPDAADPEPAEITARFPSLGLRIDGAFGPKTDKAVKKVQKSVGLAPDGDVGDRTRAALGLG